MHQGLCTKHFTCGVSPPQPRPLLFLHRSFEESTANPMFQEQVAVQTDLNAQRKGWRQHSIPALSDSKARLRVVRLFCFQSEEILCSLGNYTLFIFFLLNTPPFSPHGSQRGILALEEPRGAAVALPSWCYGYFAVETTSLHPLMLE